jgi:hypothetical protein
LKWKTSYILIYEKKLAALNELLPLLEAVVQAGMPAMPPGGGMDY